MAHGMSQTFRTKVLQTGNNTGIPVPDDVVEKLGAGKRPLVVVSVGKHTYRSAVASMGGRFMISLSAEHRAAAGVQGGDEVEVSMRLDLEPRTVPVPPGSLGRFDRGRGARGVREVGTVKDEGGRPAGRGGQDAGDAGATHREDRREAGGSIGQVPLRFACVAWWPAPRFAMPTTPPAILHSRGMPLVTIKLARSEPPTPTEKKAELISGVTALLVETLGKRQEDVVVLIEELDPNDWGQGGVTAAELRRRRTAES